MNTRSKQPSAAEPVDGKPATPGGAMNAEFSSAFAKPDFNADFAKPRRATGDVAVPNSESPK